jgi:RHS repeat-associated protein
LVTPSRWKYLFQDHLGSVDTLDDPSLTAANTEKLSFDAFGQRRAEGDWRTAYRWSSHQSEIEADREATHRGYTGHEMLDGLDLVHMNGRVYDPRLGRFLSVDPVFQFPENPQSLNPYSYVLNNPLSYTDPTGYACEAATGTHITKCVSVTAVMADGAVKKLGRYNLHNPASLASASRKALPGVARNGSQPSQRPTDGGGRASNTPSDKAGAPTSRIQVTAVPSGTRTLGEPATDVRLAAGDEAGLVNAGPTLGGIDSSTESYVRLRSSATGGLETDGGRK